MNDELMIMYSNIKQDLALRKLNGETLSPDEELVLAALNQAIKDNLPKRPSLSEEERNPLDKFYRRTNK